jgi:hypothetical protein
METKTRFKIGSTEISSRPEASVIWYMDSCTQDRGTPEIILMDSSEAKVRKAFEDGKKEDSGHYDIKLYIALATWNKENDCWDIIDDEVVDSWYDEEVD